MTNSSEWYDPTGERADKCVGENDTCKREIDWSKGEPGKDGLCTKHHIIKATPAARRR